MKTPHISSSHSDKPTTYASNGEPNECHAYSPFGFSVKLPSERAILGFSGEYINPPLKSYHLGQGYRTYSPSLMRLQSPDSLSPFGRGGINCYVYCAGDPINYTDPTGHTLVHLKNGQTMRVGKHSAVALPDKFKPSTLKRTTSHASALKSNTPAYSAPPKTTDHLMRLGEPDIFESITANLTSQDAVAFANTSRRINSFVKPILDRYIERIGVSDATMGAATAGVLPGVPKVFGQSLGLDRPEYLNDIDRITPLGGPTNFLRLLRHERQLTHSRMSLVRRDSIDDLIGA